MSDTDDLQRAARISLSKLLVDLPEDERQFIHQRFGVLLSDPPSSDELDALAKIWLKEIAAQS